jgi:hypothetical protein
MMSFHSLPNGWLRQLCGQPCTCFRPSAPQLDKSPVPWGHVSGDPEVQPQEARPSDVPLLEGWSGPPLRTPKTHTTAVVQTPAPPCPAQCGRASEPTATGCDPPIPPFGPTCGAGLSLLLSVGRLEALLSQLRSMALKHSDCDWRSGSVPAEIVQPLLQHTKGAAASAYMLGALHRLQTSV